MTRASSPTGTGTGGLTGEPRRVVCWGEVLWDIFPDARMLGGAPANVAYHLACLGERVALASRVGDDAFGHEAVRALAERGVEVSTIGFDAERPTGRVEIEFADDGREPRYRLFPGCAWERIQVTPEVERRLACADALCFGTLCLRTEIDEFERALSLLPDTCVRVCDVNLRPRFVDFELLSVALGHANVVKLNQEEARILAERAGIDDLPAWLFEHMGVELVALTRGRHGSVFFCGTEIVEHPGCPSRPGGDNVGAGDAFTAVLIHLLLRDMPLERISHVANRYAAYVASQHGATPAIPSAFIDSLCAMYTDAKLRV
jgi:fructokinase